MTDLSLSHVLIQTLRKVSHSSLSSSTSLSPLGLALLCILHTPLCLCSLLFHLLPVLNCFLLLLLLPLLCCEGGRGLEEAAD
jgi:hypothetical protein